MSITLINLAKEHCKKAAELEQKYLSTANSETQLEEILQNPLYKYVIALENDEIAGVGSVICATDDFGEILTVAVEEKSRNKGIGAKILKELEDFCHKKNVKEIFLEVEDGNLSATALYKKFGFASVGKRKGFYHGKDAIIMSKTIK